MSIPFDAHLISTKEASDLSGYNPDYLARLCRSGKIVGRQIGRAWVVDKRSLQAFVREQEVLKKQRAEELSRSREVEYRRAQVMTPAPATISTVLTVPVATFSPYRILVEKTSRPLVFSPVAAFVLSVVLMGGIIYAGNSPALARGLEAAAGTALRLASSEVITGTPHFRSPDSRSPEELAQAYRVSLPSYESVGSGFGFTEARDQLARIVVNEGPRMDVRIAAELTGDELLARAKQGISSGAYANAARPDRIALGVFSIIRANTEQIQRGHLILINAAGEQIVTLGTTVRDTSEEVARTQPAGKLTNHILDLYVDGLTAWVKETPKVADAAARTQLALGTSILDTAGSAASYLTDSPRATRNFALDVAHGTETRSTTVVEREALVALAGKAAPWLIPEPLYVFGEHIAQSVYGTLNTLAGRLGSAVTNLVGEPTAETQLTAMPEKPNSPTPTPTPTETIVAPEAAPVVIGAAAGAAAPTRGGTVVENTYVTNNFYYTAAPVSQNIVSGSIESFARSLRPTSVENLLGSLQSSALTVNTLTVSDDASITDSLTAGQITATGAINGAYFTSASVTATSTLPQLAASSFALSNDYFTDLTGNGLVVTDGTLGVSTTSLASSFFAAGGNSFGTTATLGTADTNSLTFITDGVERARITAAGNFGIGTTTPERTLTVNGSALISRTGSPQLVLRRTSPLQDWGLSIDAAGQFKLQNLTGSTISPLTISTAAEDNLVILTGSTVGIGTTTPSARLSVETPTDNDGIVLKGTSSAGNAMLRLYNDAGTYSSLFTARSGAGTDAGKFFLKVNNNSVNAIVADTAGRIGIGTTSPYATLSITDSGLSSVTSLALNNRIRFRGDGVMLWGANADAGTLSWNTGTAIVGALGATDLVIQTGGNERARVTSAGLFGVGTTSPATLFAVERTSAQTDSLGSLLIRNSNNTTGSGSNISLVTSNVNGTSQFMQWENRGLRVGTRATAAGTGNIYFTNNDSVSAFLGAGSSGVCVSTACFGIGTTSPTEKLSLYGSGNSDVSTLVETDTASYTGALLNKFKTPTHEYHLGLGGISNAAGLGDKFYLRDQTNGVNRLVVDSSGNVGIGTTSPAVALHVTNNNRQLRLDRTGVGFAELNIDNITGASNADLVFDKVVSGAGTGGFVFTPSGGTTGRVVITSTGNVGIGTTTPARALHVLSSSGSALRVGAQTDYVDYIRTGTNLWGWLTSGGNYSLTINTNSGNTGIGTTSPTAKFAVKGTGTGTGYAFQIADSADTPRLTVLDNGSVGIGTTAPAAAFHLEGTGNKQLRISSTNSLTADLQFNGVGQTWYAGAGTNGLVGFNISSSGSAGASSLFINSSGNVGIGTTSPFSTLSVAGSAAISGNVLLGTGADNSTDRKTFTFSNGGWATPSNPGSTSNGDKLVFYNNSSAKTAIGFAGDNSIWFQTNSSSNAFRFFAAGLTAAPAEIVTMQAAGNVGIGSTSPWGMLSINPNGISGPALAIGSSTATSFVVTNGGHVGVGTSDPNVFSRNYGKMLTVNSTSGYAFIQVNAPTGQAAGVDVGINGTRIAYIAADSGTGNAEFGAVGSTAKLTFVTNGVQRLAMDTAGNIGIGTSVPSYKLDVSSTTAGTLTVRVRNDDTGSNSYAMLAVNAAGNSWGLRMGSLATNSNRFDIVSDIGAPTPRLSITTAGNVGIGTTSPSQLLDINGHFTSWGGWVLSGAPGGPVGLGAGTSANTRYIGAGGSSNAWFLNVPTGGYYQFNVAETALGRWTSTGLGIGTTSPTAQFTTTGTVRFANFGTGNLQTDANGNVSVSSDERLKNITGSFSRGLADIQQLSPILYRWNEASGLEPYGTYAGFSAQNVQGAIPEAVGQDPRGFLTLTDRPILAAAVNAIKDLAGQTTQLSVATTTLSVRLSEVEHKQSAPQLPQALTATTVTADSLTTSGSVQADSVFAAALLVPNTSSSFDFGSTTIVVTLPSEVLAGSGQVNVYKLASFALASVENLATRFDTLALRLDTVESRLAMLESATSTSSTLDESFFTAFNAQKLLATVGVAFEQTTMAITDLVAKKLTVGTAEKPTGITLYDQQTGEPYCMSIKNGAQQIYKGACVVIDLAAQQAAQNMVPNETASSTPETPPETGGEPAAPASDDTGAPVVSLNGQAAIEITVGGAWNDPGATATDATDGDLTGAITVSGAVNVNAPGLYTITYSATDAAGNTGSASRTVVVKQSSESVVASAE